MNIYLISSESRVLMEQEVNKIIASSKNKVVYNADDSKIEDILSEASYVSMFNEMKYLVVKNANFFGSRKLKEDEENMLLSYLREPYPLTTIIFTTYESIDARKKITKQIKENFHYINIVPPKGLELYQKVTDLLIAKKYYAEKDSIQYIINACIGNFDLIASEIEKIDLYYGKSVKIDLKTVKQIVSKTMSENQFKFIDAVIEKNIKKAKQLYNELLILKIEPLALINLLAREYRFLIEIKNMEKKHASKKEIKDTLKVQDWQLEKLQKEASLYHEDDLRDYIIRLEKLDYGLKSGQLDKQLSLDLFLIDLYEY